MPAYCGLEVSPFFEHPPQARDSVLNEFGLDPSTRILLFVGRLASNLTLNQKNPDFAIEVAARCIAQDPSVVLLMVGSGETARRALDSRVAAMGLGNHIRLLGERTDIARLMLAADLLLFPSFAEGLGMVTVEAQAAGLRVLASDTTPRECIVVEELVTFLPLALGTLIWANRALSLLCLPRLSNALCNEAVKKSQFAIENSAFALLNVYRS
jgi:glycosyltransferase involved in cell wall biosynthesis